MTLHASPLIALCCSSTETGARNAVFCEVCGDGFVNFACLERHQRYNSQQHEEARQRYLKEKEQKDSTAASDRKEDGGRKTSASPASASASASASDIGSGDHKYDVPDHVLRSFFDKTDVRGSLESCKQMPASCTLASSL